jgi:DNA replication protein DnaC
VPSRNRSLTHLAIGLGVKAAHTGYSMLFDTANNWIISLAAARQAGQLEAELRKIRRASQLSTRASSR